MLKQEVLESLKTVTKKFPKEALEEIRANREDYIPELLESLDYIHRNIEELYENDAEDNYYFLATYAMYLLAEFREKKAFPYLIALMRFPEDYADYVFGDIITEDLKNILLCTFDETDSEHMQILREIIENQELFEWSRNAALDAYVLLYLENHVKQEEFIAYIRSLIYDKLVDDESFIIQTALVGCIIDSGIIQMIPDARFMYDEDRVDLSMHGDYDSFIDWMFKEELLRLNEKKRYIENADDVLKKWACFDKDETSKKEPVDIDDAFEKFINDGINKDREQEQRFIAQNTQNVQIAQNVQKKPKPGRNDPCPCGSGKKYKKCCINAKDVAVAPSDMPVIRIEDKYDLLEDYPKDSPLFNELYEKEAVEIDILVYKALHHRAIPLWVKRDFGQEHLGKIDYLNKALKLFSDKCDREQITSFADYDKKYMVHYRSAEWVEELISLTEDEHLQKTADTRKTALDIIKKFEGK